MTARALSEYDRLILNQALDVLRRHNISEIRPNARDAVLVIRGYGKHAVQGYADTLSGAVIAALEASQ